MIFWICENRIGPSSGWKMQIRILSMNESMHIFWTTGYYIWGYDHPNKKCKIRILAMSGCISTCIFKAMCNLNIFIHIFLSQFVFVYRELYNFAGDACMLFFVLMKSAPQERLRSWTNLPQVLQPYVYVLMM